MLPNLIVIGAMKSGTTSLHYYLSLHPEIFMSANKEPTFFTEERNWHRGVSWYESLFPIDAAVRGEASPDYTKYPSIAGVPARIHSVIPDVRMVYLVRDPIERIVSHYIDAYSFGRVTKSLNDELADLESNHLVSCSRYFMQIQQYLEYFDPGQLMVVTTEELRDEPAATMRSIFEFLDVDPGFSSAEFNRILYTAEEKQSKTRLGYALLRLADRVRDSRARPYLPTKLMWPIYAFNALTGKPIPKPELAESRRRELTEFLRLDVDSLRAFTGKSLPTWPR